jgi:hypothetical protein
MEQHALKNVNNCCNTNIYSYLETSGGQNSNPYLYVVHFKSQVLIRHLWQLKTVVFLHRCLKRAVLLELMQRCSEKAHKIIFIKIEGNSKRQASTCMIIRYAVPLINLNK